MNKTSIPRFPKGVSTDFDDGSLRGSVMVAPKPSQTELVSRPASFGREAESVADSTGKKRGGGISKRAGTGAAIGFSRDEMNLAEFPLTVLSSRVDPKLKTLEFTDQLRTKTGELVERKWIITAADKFGLPTSTDDDVVLGLIRLTMDQGFRERKVYFTRYELLRTLRWSTEGRSYSRLVKSLDRLSGVRIRSSNSFYDNTSKSYQTTNFGLIDAYEINDNRGVKLPPGVEPPKSFFIWSEVMFDSFQAGYIKKLDLDLYFSLKSSVSRRLYRYLDKHFYFKRVVEKPLMALAFEKLGLSRNYKYISTIRQQIEPAAEELLKIGFLESFEFLGRGEQTTIRFSSSQQTTVPAPKPIEGRRSSESPFEDGPWAELAEDSAPDSSVPLGSKRLNGANLNSKALGIFAAELQSRGIAAHQLTKLLEARSEADLPQLKAILRYYDHLVAQGDAKVSRNACGFLYRAVENPDRFVVPEQFLDKQQVQELRQSVAAQGTRAARAVRPELKIFKASKRAGGEPALAAKSADAEQLRLAEYRDFVEQEFTRGIERLNSEQISSVYSSVEKKVSCLKSVLSADRFQEALERCVKEELGKLIGIPDFKGWNARKR